MRVTVVIAAHNESAFLRHAVLSVLDENLEGTEIVVVDDASDDGSLEQLKDLPVTPIKLPRRQGVAGARNEGIHRARSSLVTFLDGDDILAPGGLRWRVEWLESHPEELAVSGTLGGCIDDKGRPLRAEFGTGFSAFLGEKIAMADVARLGRVQGAAWAVLFRKRWLVEEGGFDVSYQYDPDTDLLLRLLRRRALPFFRRPVVRYRVHGKNQTLVDGECRQHARTLAETWLANERWRSP